MGATTEKLSIAAGLSASHDMQEWTSEELIAHRDKWSAQTIFHPEGSHGYNNVQRVLGWVAFELGQREHEQVVDNAFQTV